MRYLLTCGLVACFCWSTATAQTYDFDALKIAPGASKPLEVAKPAARKPEAPVAEKPASRTHNTSPKPAGDENSFAVLSNRWVEQFDAEKYETANLLADSMLLSASEPKEQRVFLGLAHRAKAMSLWSLKDPKAAIRHQEQALSIYREEGVTDEIADLEAEFDRYRRMAQLADQAFQPEAATSTLPIEELELTFYDHAINNFTDFIWNPVGKFIEGFKEIAKFYALDTSQSSLEVARTLLLIVATSLILALATPSLLMVLQGLLYIGKSLVLLGLLPFYVAYAIAQFFLALLVRHWRISLAICVLASTLISFGSGRLNIMHLAIGGMTLLFLFATKRLEKPKKT